MLVSCILLVVGMILLIKGADLFVDGSSKVAKFFKIPSLIIGLTLVSMGTSAPEASVSINAAVNNLNDLSIGNVVGSNIFNTLLIMFISYIIFLIYRAKKDKIVEEVKQEKTNLFKSLIFVAVGLASIIFGGDMVVDSASKIAQKLGMSQSLVGLTIVAVGTSLPELVTSIVASIKKENDIAIGNVVGSNIFNVIFILGASSTISTLTLNNALIFDMVVMLTSGILLILFTLFNEKINKKQGIILILLYVAYLTYIIIRN